MTLVGEIPVREAVVFKTAHVDRLISENACAVSSSGTYSA